MPVTKQSTLTRIDGYPFPVLCSAGAEEQSRVHAARAAQALAFLSDVLDFSPRLRVLTLAPEDWDLYATVPLYGMPHYAGDTDIVVGTSLGEFWHPVIQMLDEVATPEELADLAAVHGMVDGHLDFLPFADLLPVHELGHIFHEQVPFRFPRLWLMEWFCNLCLHAYLAAEEPEQLPIWTSPSQLFGRVPAGRVAHHSLEDFERVYNSIDGDNYVWYQFRFIRGVERVYGVGGVEVLQRLYHTFRDLDQDLSDEQLVHLLEEQVHPSLARFMRDWPA